MSILVKLDPSDSPSKKLSEGISKTTIAKLEKIENESKCILGYNLPAKTIGKPGLKKDKDALLAILREHDIKYYDPESVTAYRKEKQAEVNKATSGWGRYNWKSTVIELYRKQIPIEALKLAIKVKKACSLVILEIDELKKERLIDDPMMFACLGQARLCIAVWDEPGFDAQLLS